MQRVHRGVRIVGEGQIEETIANALHKRSMSPGLTKIVGIHEQVQTGGGTCVVGDHDGILSHRVTDLKEHVPHQSGTNLCFIAQRKKQTACFRLAKIIRDQAEISARCSFDTQVGTNGASSQERVAMQAARESGCPFQFHDQPTVGHLVDQIPLDHRMEHRLLARLQYDAAPGCGERRRFACDLISRHQRD